MLVCLMFTAILGVPENDQRGRRGVVPELLRDDRRCSQYDPEFASRSCEGIRVDQIDQRDP